jgi:hypothetical protein
MNEEMDNLDHAIREMYRAEFLPAERMEALLSQIAAQQRPMLMRQWTQRQGTWVSAIAAMLVICASLAMWMHTHRLTVLAVAEDVERHHVKPFEQEFAATDVPSLGAQMKDLDFKPVIPDRVADQPFELLGARHCHVGNTQAVQLRLKDQAGQVRTLCEFRAGDTQAIGDGKFTINGLSVNVWHEKDLVFAMTGPVP